MKRALALLALTAAAIAILRASKTFANGFDDLTDWDEGISHSGKVYTR